MERERPRFDELPEPLFKPAIGIRVRFGMNDPTPWPPEVPAGENPPPRYGRLSNQLADHAARIVGVE